MDAPASSLFIFICIGEQWQPLRRLDFGATHRTGPLPLSLCKLTQLENLGLGSNHLTGEIPSCLGSLSKLHSLGLNTNQLTGTIPSALCGAPLSYLGLFSNHLTGQIPACLGQLKQLHLDNNQLDSPLHEAFVTQVLNNPQLIQLTLAKNNFGSEDCQAIQTLIARGEWANEVPGGFPQGFLHSPQNSGFDFTTDCQLALTLTIHGNGKVIGNGIDCEGQCVQNYPFNTEVSLTAQPHDAQTRFMGWSGDCQGQTATVVLNMKEAKNCTAKFQPLDCEPALYTLETQQLTFSKFLIEPYLPLTDVPHDKYALCSRVDQRPVSLKYHSLQQGLVFSGQELVCAEQLIKPLDHCFPIYSDKWGTLILPKVKVSADLVFPEGKRLQSQKCYRAKLMQGVRPPGEVISWSSFSNSKLLTLVSVEEVECP